MAETVTMELEIINKKGLHARPAAKMVRLAAEFPDAIIRILKVSRPNGVVENVCVLAHSVLGMLMLAAEQGSNVLFEAEGTQAAEALAAVAALIESRFEEVE